MRPSPWPTTYRIDPGIKREVVIAAIKGLKWHPDEWKSLQVAANFFDKRAETPATYCAFLKRSKAGFWPPSEVLFLATHHCHPAVFSISSAWAREFLKMNSYARRFEILELVGGWGVANAPHGEIVGSYETLLDANVALLEFEQGLDEPAKFWIVDSFVCEPGLGNQLGELPEFDLEGATCLRMTQAQFDQLCELYFKEHGHYPNT